LQEYNRHIERIRELEQILSSEILSNYERNRLQNELITLRRRNIDAPAFEPSLRTQVRIDELRRSLSERDLLFSGYLTIYRIFDPSLPEVREIFPEIENYIADNQPKQSVFNNK